MNSARLGQLRIAISAQSILNPSFAHALVAGDGETSQHVTNALFGALAINEGPMNDLTSGKETYRCYSARCSGAPAGVTHAGSGLAPTSRAHVHVLNSSLTEPAVQEMRLPFLLAHFGLREHYQRSYAPCAYPAGNRTLWWTRICERMDCEILPSFRSAPPRDIAGGGHEQSGRTEVRRFDGGSEELRASGQTILEVGEAVTLVTPAADGHGPV